MRQVLKYTGYVLILAVIGYMIWRFSYIIAWILIAAVLSFVGQPLVRFFDRIHIRKLKMPHSLSALLSLIIIVLALFGLMAIFVPLIINQADTISKIDVNKLAQNLQGPLQWIDTTLHDFGAIPAGQTLQDFVIDKAKSLVNLGNVGPIISNFISVAGNIFIGLFSILFIAFFFLKDEKMFEDGLLLFIPEKHHNATHKVVSESKNLLVRYYIGVLAELIGVMSLISIGLWIFGVKNALLIGFFGGIMNIIPYIGPVIGSIIGTVLGITTILSTGSYSELLPVTLKLVGTFLVVNFIYWL